MIIAEKYRSNKSLIVLTSIIMNLICISIFLFVTGTYYDVTDTLNYSTYIAEGDYFLKFTNYFLCLLCGLIQKFIYPLNAYAVVDLLLSFISFVVISYILIEKNGYKIGFVMNIFLFSFFAVNHYGTISFSLTPALLTTAGLLSLLYSYKEGPKILLITGILLTFFGSLYRFQVFLVVFCAFLIFYFFLILISNYNKTVKVFTKKYLLSSLKLIFNKKAIICLVIIVVITFGANTISKYLNVSTEELSYYDKYTVAHSSIGDFKIPDYSLLKEEYESIGISENDFKLIKSEYYDDEGALPIEKIQQIRQLADDYYAKQESDIQRTIRQLKIELLDTLFANTDKSMLFRAFFMVSLVSLIFLKKRYYILVGIMNLYGLFVLTYLSFTDRPLYRAVYGAFFSMIIFLLYLFDRDNIKENLLSKKMLINIVCIITVIISVITIPINYSANYRLLYKSAIINHKEDCAEMVDYITSHANDKFVCTKGSFIRKTDNSLNPLFIYVPDKYENTISFDSGCYYYSPNNLRKIHEFGADNLYSYLINNEGVYLVDYKDVDFASNLLEYLNKYYSSDHNLKLVKEKSVANFNIYSVVSE